MNINFDDKMVLDTLDEKPKVNSNLDKWLTFLTEPKKEGMEVLEITKNALKKGFDISVIMDITGLNEEEVLKIKYEMDKK
jgi:hypothetical protein